MSATTGTTSETWTPKRVQTTLQACPQTNGTLVLTRPTFAQEVDDVLAAMDLDSLELDDSKIAPSADGAAVSGTAALLGSLTADVTLTLAVEDGVLAVTVAAKFATGARIQILGLDWASVGDLELALETTGPPLPLPVVTPEMRGTVDLDGTPIHVTLGPAGGAQWLLSATDIPLPPPESFARLLAGQHAAQLTPPNLELKGFAIDLSCGFEPADMKVRSLSARIASTSPEPWTFDGFPAGVKGISLTIDLAFGDDGAAPDVTVGAEATVTLGSATDLPVVVRREPDHWTVGIVGATGLPSLGEIVAAASADTAKLLPETVGELQLKSLSLELTLGETEQTLRSILFSTQLADWPLIKDAEGKALLALEGVALQVLADCTNSDNTSGFATGTIEIDGFALPVAVEWPPGKAPWTLSLGSNATHTISGMSSLGGFAGGGDVKTSIPTGFPGGSLELKDLSMSFDPVTSSVASARLELGSQGEWKLPETDIDVHDLALKLNVAWPADEKRRQITGSVGGTIDVGGARVSIAASKTSADDWAVDAKLTVSEVDFELKGTHAAAGWTFEGSGGLGAEIPLGKVVEDLAAELKLDFPIPAALAGATLSNLRIKFDTSGSTFSFSGDGQVPVDGHPLTAHLTIDVGKTDATFGGWFTVPIQVGDKTEYPTFTLYVSSDVKETRLVAAYTHDASVPALKVADLVQAVVPSAAGIPEDLSVDLKDVAFATASGDEGTRVVFALDLAEIDLSKLPVVGSLIPGAKVDDLKVIAATAAPVGPTDSDPGDIAAWNKLLPKEAKLPATGVGEGVAVSAVLQLAEMSTPLALPASTSTPSGSAPSGTKAPATTTTAATKWFAVQRALGPFYLDRVGGRYDAGKLWLLLDASMTLGGLSISLVGLGVGSKLSEFDPEPNLDGLGLAFKQDPVEIAGSFLAVPPSEKVQFQYDGAAVVRAESFALSAVGSYAKLKDGASSLFIFVELDAPLGGPPALYITGLMGGFGYNRALRIPNQDEVYKFPFVQGLDGGGAGTGGAAGALAKLEQGENPWLTVKEDENWVAVGVTFTSFEVVESKALLIAEFGKELQFALIGLSKLRLPQEGDEEFAYLELEIEAILKPNEGFFGLTAQVSPNSFVIDRACRLTGGFAFYLWFDGEHAGDFVLTLGGYHPAFSPPAHYPKEPRLGLSWPVNDLVSIDGSAYFALTPSCVMGGGGMHVLFHDGNLRAWLTASADFLISWEPFQYAANIGVSVGVSYQIDWGKIQKTLSAELGAQLTLWGPPTGGTAHVSWYVISFTIGFGADPPEPPKKKPDWSSLKPLLPDELCKVTLASGLLPGTQTGLEEPRGAKADDAWLVRADTLQLVTESAVPATKLYLGAAEFTPAAKPPPPAVRPLGLAKLEATHTLRVKGPQGELDLKADKWSVKERTRSMPSSLWGAPLGKNDSPLEGDSLIPDQLVGFTIAPPDAKEGPKLANPIDLTYPQRPPDGTLPSADRPKGPVAKVAPKDALAAIATIATDGQARRAAIRDVLHAKGLDPGTDDALADFAANAEFPVPPMLLGPS